MANDVTPPPRRIAYPLFAILCCSIPLLGAMAEILNWSGVTPRVILHAIRPLFPNGSITSTGPRPREDRPIHLILIVENSGLVADVDSLGHAARPLTRRLGPSDCLSIFASLDGRPLLARVRLGGDQADAEAARFFDGLYPDPKARPDSALEPALRLRSEDRRPDATLIVSVGAVRSGARAICWSSPTQFVSIDPIDEKAIERLITSAREGRPGPFPDTAEVADAK